MFNMISEQEVVLFVGFFCDSQEIYMEIYVTIKVTACDMGWNMLGRYG